MKQTWANYYEYLTHDKVESEIHQLMAEEREHQLTLIRVAEEHLQGISLFYKQSPLEDPKVPYASSEKKHTETINHARELSDKMI